MSATELARASCLSNPPFLRMPRLQLEGLNDLRAEAAPLSIQIAGHVSSEQFKSKHAKSMPLGMAMVHHFSTEAAAFSGSVLKKTANKLIFQPTIALGTGRPGADMYPWQAIDVRASESLPADQGANNTTCNTLDRLSSAKLMDPTPSGYPVGRALNYSHAAGSQPLVRFFTEHVELVHNPPYRGWGTMLSSGSTSAMEMALRIFCNPGDTILTERYTYPGTLEGAHRLNLHCIGIDMDDDGLSADALEHTLAAWNLTTQGRRPHVLYTIPTGHNPTGITQPLSRRRAIYALAQQYDLLIVEDDPYYFLPLQAPVHSSSAPCSPEYIARGFISSLPASYLSLDTTGRVIRLDSTSKILSPGLRAGWITAADSVIDKFIAYTEVSSVSVSGPSQLLLHRLLEEQWGHEGFLVWLSRLAVRYRQRMEMMVGACERFGRGRRWEWEWRVPEGGMFLWLTVLRQRWQEGRGGGALNVREYEEKVVQAAMDHGVQVTMGSLFDTRTSERDEVHLRLTFAAAEIEELVVGTQKLAAASDDLELLLSVV